MRFGDKIVSIPTVAPAFNVGGMLDIPTGTYFFGKYGQSVLNGGLGDSGSIVGVGNSYKSTLVAAIHLTVVERIAQAENINYDTENVHTYHRVMALCKRLPNLSLIDFCDPADTRRNRVMTTSSSTIDFNGKILYGDRFHEQVAKYAREVYAQKKPIWYTTPFREGLKPILMRAPTTVSYDSFSKMRFSSIEEGKKDDHKIGDSERNTVSLDEGRLKTQMNNEMPGLSRLGELRITMTAHTDKSVNMEGKYASEKPKLTHGKKDYQIKGVGTAFMQINEWILDIQSSVKLEDKDKCPEYPLDETERNDKCKDLNLITAVITRNKKGASGTVLKMVVSQSEGYLPHVSMYRLLKEDEYGLIKKGHHYSSVLLPEVSVQRNTLRKHINENYALRRALEITSEMLQMQYLFSPAGKQYLCTPEELYTDLINMGYSWDTLLNKTRGYWIFEEEDNNNLPFLSTMDLLRMRGGVYVPYWLKKPYIKQATGYLKEVLNTIPESQLRDK